MKDFINQFLGQQGGQAVQMIGALIVVVALIVIFAWVMRRLSGGKTAAPRKGDRPTQRLAVVDAAHVDGQRRLVLVRRDDVEHLVMIGGPNDVLIEPRIVRGQPLGGQRQPAQQMVQPVMPVGVQPQPTSMAAMQPPQQPQPMRNTAPQPVPEPVAMQPVMAPQPVQQQPMAHQPSAPQPQMAQAPISMPPPFVEPVTSPASSLRANPVAADLRAAMSDQRRDENSDRSPTRMPPQRPMPPMNTSYEDATVAVPPSANRGDYRGNSAPSFAGQRPPQAQPAPQQSYPQRGQRNSASLEDMVAAGLEEAISRPDVPPQRMPPAAPPRSSGGTGGAARSTAGAPFGQRGDAPRSPAKDPMAAEIEKAIYGLTSAPAPAPSVRPEPSPRVAQPTYSQQRASEPSRADAFYRAPMPPAEPQRPSDVTRPVQARTAPQPAVVRPTLVANQDAGAPHEPVVAVMPPAEQLRANDGRRSSSEIEDEMARLLSELTGTTGR